MLVGCEDEEVREYTVEKPAAPTTAPTAASAPAAPMMRPTETRADAASMSWSVPVGWEEVERSAMSRVATYRVGEVEIAITRFPGDVGGTLANVNRWRGQVGLPPVKEGDLASLITPFKKGEQTGYTLRVRGEKQHMLVGAISDPKFEQTWFVRATTPPELADRYERDVFEFARSFGRAGAVKE